MHPEGVVQSADAQALAKKGKFWLRVLAQLDTLMHGTTAVCFRQKLVPLQLQVCCFRKPQRKERLTSKHHSLSSLAELRPGLADKK